jgi:hypothetical protein
MKVFYRTTTCSLLTFPFWYFPVHRSWWRPLGLREVEAPTFSDIRLIDGGKFVSRTLRPLGLVPQPTTLRRAPFPEGYPSLKISKVYLPFVIIRVSQRNVLSLKRACVNIDSHRWQCPVLCVVRSRGFCPVCRHWGVVIVNLWLWNDDGSKSNKSYCVLLQSETNMVSQLREPNQVSEVIKLRNFVLYNLKSAILK